MEKKPSTYTLEQLIGPMNDVEKKNSQNNFMLQDNCQSHYHLQESQS